MFFVCLVCLFVCIFCFLLLYLSNLGAAASSSSHANTCFSFGRKLKDECTCFDLCFFVVLLEHFQRWNDAPCHRLLLSVNGSNRDLSEEIQLYPCFLKQHHAWTLQPTNADHSYQLITLGSDERKISIKLVPMSSILLIWLLESRRLWDEVECHWKSFLNSTRSRY